MGAIDRTNKNMTDEERRMQNQATAVTQDMNTEMRKTAVVFAKETLKTAGAENAMSDEVAHEEQYAGSAVLNGMEQSDREVDEDAIRTEEKGHLMAQRADVGPKSREAHSALSVLKEDLNTEQMAQTVV